MSWLKKTIRDWLTHDQINVERTIGGREKVARFTSSSFTMNVTEASNGHVLEITKYDFKTDQPVSVMRVCPSGVPMMDEIAALIAEFKLR